jgi:hypothetical protein
VPEDHFQHPVDQQHQQEVEEEGCLQHFVDQEHQDHQELQKDHFQHHVD